LESSKVSLITAISSAELNEIARRPRITGFVLDKAKKEINYLPHEFEKGLKKT
jgi:dTDP-4-dehydrorhamnose reductase